MTKAAQQGLLVAGVLAVIAALSVLLQQPLLAPSLGSAVFVQVMSPNEPSAKPWNTAVGQLVGLAAGFIGIYVAFASTVPVFLAGHPLVWARVLAVVVAIGAETANWAGFGRMALAIVLVTALGEIARQIMLERS